MHHLDKATKARLLVLLCIIALGVALSYAFFYGPSQVGGDDYEYVYFGWISAHQGIGVLARAGVLGQKFILNLGIAFFYELFGVGQLTSTFFSEACFIGTIIAVYLIGSDLYNKNAGLLASLFYAIMPIALISASGVSDDLPMAFFASLAMLFIIRSVKSHETVKSVYYATASGFFAVVGFLITAEAIIIMLPVIAVAIFYTVKNRGHRFLYFPGIAMGVVLAVFLIMSLGFISSGNPMLVFGSTSSWYSQTIWVTGGYKFPEIASLYYATLLPIYLPQQNSTGLDHGFAGYLLPSHSNELPNPYYQYYYGWFFYAAIVVFAITALRRRPGIAIPAAWIALTLAYLIFGTMSLHHYVNIPPFPRYTQIFTPAVALLLGIGFADVLPLKNKVKRRTKSKTKYSKPVYRKYITYAIFIAVLMLLFVQSVYSVWAVQNSARIATTPFIEAASYIDAHPTSQIMESSTLIPIQVYINFKYPVTLLNTQQPNCKAIINGSYIISETNSSFKATCGLHRIAGPFAIPNDVFARNLLDFDGIANSYGMGNISIYEK